MTTKHLSIRVPAETLARLDGESLRSGTTRSELANTLLDEGLRMQAHPGIVFRSGVSGRRPALADGPDVWVVARVLRGVHGNPEAVVAQTAELTGLHPVQVRIAARYYAEFREEIDAWIRRLDDEADRSEAEWRRQQDLLRA